MAKLIDLRGQRFGRLIVQSAVKTTGRREYSWVCLCDCGTRVTVRGSHLRSGASTSCGCFRKDFHTKHGHTSGYTSTAEYRAWRNMIKRCEYEKDNRYADYGGRGIQICPEWRVDFERFLADVGPRPSSQHSLDRIDPDGNYEPGNCRWATKAIQSRNQRSRRRSNTGYRGVYLEARSGKFVVQIDALNKTMHVGTFNDLDTAIKARKEAEVKYWGSDNA